MGKRFRRSSGIFGKEVRPRFSSSSFLPIPLIPRTKTQDSQHNFTQCAAFTSINLLHRKYFQERTQDAMTLAKNGQNNHD